MLGMFLCPNLANGQEKTNEVENQIADLISKGALLMYDAPDSSELLLNQALALAIKNDLSFLTAEVYRTQAAFSYIKADYPTSFHLSQTAEELYRLLGNELGIALVSNTIGLIYQVQGNSEKAIQLHSSSIKLAKNLMTRHF